MTARCESAATEVAADCLSSLSVSGEALIVDDPAGALAATVRQAGCRVSLWSRYVTGSAPASAWPSAGPFDLATVRLPRSRDAFQMILHAVGSRLRAGGRILVYGRNDQGIKSAPSQIEPLFGPVETLDARRHCRVLLATLPDEPPIFRGRLHQWQSEVVVDSPDDRALRWASYPGVFAHGRLDEGTAFLLTCLPDVRPRERVLDFGCGAGVIAMELLRRQPAARLDLLDNDALAIEAARMNVACARTILGDGLAALTGQRYRFIVSNPPIHRGKAKDFSLLADLITGAATHLTRAGSLRFVVQRTAPIARLIRDGAGDGTVVAENAHFRVWDVRYPRR